MAKDRGRSQWCGGGRGREGAGGPLSSPLARSLLQMSWASPLPRGRLRQGSFKVRRPPLPYLRTSLPTYCISTQSCTSLLTHYLPTSLLASSYIHYLLHLPLTCQLTTCSVSKYWVSDRYQISRYCTQTMTYRKCLGLHSHSVDLE